MLNQTAKVKYAMLNAPYLLPLYLKEPYKPQITKTTLQKMLNRSCGIEIECFGSLLWLFRHIFHNTSTTCDRFTLSSTVRKYYDIMDFDEDNTWCYDSYDASKNEFYDNEFNEHKIRISDHKQLTGLYNILADMKKHCRLNMDSGIHIHIDITDLFAHPSFKRYGEVDSSLVAKFVASYLEPRMDEIEQIFYPGSKYLGGYNTSKAITTWKNHKWVAVRHGYNTIEFRIAPMTFEYTDIARWCVELCQLVNKMILSDKEISKSCNVRAKIKEKPKPIITKPVDLYEHWGFGVEEEVEDDECEVIEEVQSCVSEDIPRSVAESYTWDILDISPPQAIQL